MDDRIRVANKIQATEWDSILVHSAISYEKRVNKADSKKEKSIEKGKVEEGFSNTRKAIYESVLNESIRDEIIVELNDMIQSITDLGNEILTVNVENDHILIKKEANKEELREMARRMNELRRSSFDKVIDFHVVVVENCSEKEMTVIMKAMNKELSVTEK